MCLSRVGTQHQRLQARVEHERAIAFTSCTSSSSTVGTSASGMRQLLWSRRSTCCRSWSRAPREDAFVAHEVLGEQRRAGQLGRVVVAPSRGGAPPAPKSIRRRQRRARGASCSCERRSDCAAASRAAERLAFAVHQVLVEARRAAHRLARVVDQEVEAVERPLRCRQNASTLGVAAGRGRAPAAGRASACCPPRARSAVRRRAGSASSRSSRRRPAAAGCWPGSRS